MKLEADGIVTSATDLANFMGCKHVTHLDKRSVVAGLEKPFYNNPLLEELKKRGEQHEQNYLHYLKDQGRPGVELDSASTQAVVEAMESGVDYIYQAYLRSGSWRGYADFLIKTDKPSNLGNWSYEVLDAKLAKETRGETILQLCVYSEILNSLQGAAPEFAYVLTPNSTESEPYQLTQYMAYYRLVKNSFSSYAESAEDEESYPEPCEKCDRCDWYARCEKQWRDDDHLTFVAGIHRSQRAELVERGVTTLAELANLELPLSKPSRGSVESLARVREQARVQLQARETDELVSELLEPEEGQGAYLLPLPSPGDVFFDIEGARFVGDQGFEYLLGFSYFNENKKLVYEHFLANNPAEESGIFDQFMLKMDEIINVFPDMHIYHFHSYEPSALKRLAGRYAMQQDLLDDMLRHERFIELHRVTRQAVRCGLERYSIKDLEPFFGFDREVDLRTAGDARHQLKNWLEAGHAMNEATSGQVEIVIGYNKDDCVATHGLREWLEGLRSELVDQGHDITRPVANPEISEELSERLAMIRALSDQLREGLPESGEGLSNEDRARWLLSHLLEFYRREDKSTYWEKFRLAELDDEGRMDDKSAVAGLVYMEFIDHTKTGIPTDRYSFPPQELTIKAGDALYIDKDTKWGSKVVEIDYENCTLDLKKTKVAAEIHASSAFSWGIVTNKEAENALVRLAQEVLADNNVGVVTNLLEHALPKLEGANSLTDAQEANSDVLDLAQSLVAQLDESVLGIQGPPGTGKTYTSAYMILAAARAGLKIGVTAQSHKVITNLLKEVAKIARENEVTLKIIRKPKAVNDVSEEDQDEMIDLASSNDAIFDALGTDYDVAAGTAWLWPRESMKDVVDVLFIDEAGQFSLANTVACAQAATSLVLLGDPQQLDQPLQGSHPPGTDVSGLQHILGDHITMPKERGLFLPDTYRMQPNITEYISEMFYEGKLVSAPGLENQKIVHKDFPEGAGLWYLPTIHQNNQNASIEEAERVADLVAQLLDGGSWIDHEGREMELELEDVLVVTPYNAQVSEISKRIPGVKVGTVDKFQGQQAPVVIISYASSTPEDAPRGMDFLYSLNRLNVAVSRAKCAVFLICSTDLVQPECKNPAQMRLANGLASYVEKSYKV